MGRFGAPPFTSTRAETDKIGVCHGTVLHTISWERIQPFLLQRVQILNAEEHPCGVEIVWRLLQIRTNNLHFPASVFLTDDTSIITEDIFNTQKKHD